MVKKENIRNQSLTSLESLFQDWQEPRFKSRQVYDWIWKKGVTDFALMTDISKTLREKLNDYFQFFSLQSDIIQESQLDHTIKTRFLTHDGHALESVLIPSPTQDLLTLCVSSQIGCSLSCTFCATGKMERIRNLEAEEIFDQYVKVNQQALTYFHKPLTNIVYMGMGEPLLNYQNVLLSIEKISKYGENGFSPKRITVSTAGIAKMIRKLADDEVRFNLALSLHAANDDKRSEIMAINDTNQLSLLVDALKYFTYQTNNQITLEYILLKDFNDNLEDAKELCVIAKKIPCKINIIEYNSIGDGAFEASSESKLNIFVNHLVKNRLTVNIRRSRGKDIDAACGQLANK